MVTMRGTLNEFIEDIEPFFYGKRLTYIDVGAYKGEIFKALLKSKLSIRESHLFEANPKTYVALKDDLSQLHIKNCHVYNVALSDSQGSLSFQDNDSMSKVIVQTNVDSENTFQVNAIMLDDFLKSLTEQHIAILKVDVEGHEKEVFSGAKELLTSQSVDLIYVEAGMNRENFQQTYYRDIDDILASYGYKIFRFYEQMFEWMEDSPFLRRINIAYMSEKFAQNNPFRLSHQIFELSKTNNLLKKQTEEHKAQIARLNTSIEDLKKQSEKYSSELNLKKQEIVSKNHEIASLHVNIEELKTKDDLEALKQDNELLLVQLHYLQEELEKRSEDSEKILGAVEIIKNRLAYRFGSLVIREYKSLLGILLLPFSIFVEYRNYRHQKKLLQKKSKMKLHLYDDYQEALKVEKSLPYQLGEVILKDVKSVIGIVRLPFSIYKVRKNFKTKK